MRGNGLDRERTSDAHFGTVLVGSVVEMLELRLCCDGSIDLSLPADASFPPGRVQLSHRVRPLRVSVSRYLPLLPRLLQRSVQPLSDWLQLLLPLLKKDLDLAVVRDGLQ